MRRTILILLLAFGLALMGCVQTGTVIKLKPNGSGTIEQTLLIGRSMVDELKSSVAQSLSEEEAKAFMDEPFSLTDEDELKAGAAHLGKGVKYVSMENVETDKFSGYKAIYKFKDISKLTLNQNPGANLPGGESGAPQAEEFVLFKFKNCKKGKPSVLTVVMPEDLETKIETETVKQAEEPELTPEEQGMQDAQEELMMQMLKGMLGGMRVSMAIEFDGELVKTNASFVDGNRVTIMDMDFDALLASEEAFKEFASSNPENLGSAKDIMKNIPGMKVEVQKVVTISFK